MEYRTLGTTDIEVSALAFGCWAIIGGFTWGEQDRSESRDALRAAYDAGVTFFDTAEGYGKGESEELVGEALADIRDSVVIASKVAPKHCAPADLRLACERSLARLRTDRIDLYQLHWPRWDIPFEETFAVLDALQDEGKIRSWGVSNFARRDLHDAVAVSHRMVSNQLCYNLLFRGVECDVRDVCVENAISILAYSPIAQGLLAGTWTSADDMPPDRARTRHFSSTREHAKHGEAGAEGETFAAVERVRAIAAQLGESMADVAMAWLLAQPGVTSVIAGGRSVAQARRNTRAAALALPPDVLAALNEATADLKQKLGPNIDPWQVGTRAR